MTWSINLENIDSGMIQDYEGEGEKPMDKGESINLGMTLNGKNEKSIVNNNGCGWKVNENFLVLLSY